MFETSFRRLTGTVTAAALALGVMTAAAPAYAEQDAARVIGGLAAIALGAKIIHDNREERRDADRRRDWNEHRWDRDDDDDDDDRRWNRGRDRDRHQARLPERCIADYDRRRGQVIAVYDENCLRRHARR